MIDKTFVYIFLAGDWVPCGFIKFYEEGRFSYSEFRYGKKYLEREDRLSIDPAHLPLIDKTFQTEEGIYIFNGVRDAGPDKWGRYLLDKKYDRGISELEYIASIGPDRVGAIAFGPNATDGPKKSGIKGWEPYVGRRLSLEICVDGVEDAIKNESTEKLKIYLDYAPSLGGARPKATVDWKQSSYLAKFSISLDEKDEPLIEYATMKLAKKCGLNVPELDYVKVLDRSVYLIKRFDRDNKGNPIPFISALSATGLAENDYQDWSYFKICDAIKKLSPAPEEDLKELFSRLVFNICVYNNDDHMRNHGFLYADNNQWSLSPLYDVVPGIISTNTYALAMTFGDEGKRASVQNAMSRCGEFALDKNTAQKIVNKISKKVKNWEKHFNSEGVKADDIERLRNSFKEKK
jgi:serine/threonine-protein kinase HipA